MKTTHFNTAQLDVIRTLSFAKSKRVAEEVKRVIVEHFSASIDEEMDKLWDSGQFDNERNEVLIQQHLRTAYKK